MIIQRGEKGRLGILRRYIRFSYFTKSPDITDPVHHLRLLLMFIAPNAHHKGR